MVKDNRFSTSRSKRMKRRSSWKDVFRDLTSGSDRESEPLSGPQTRRLQSTPQSPHVRGQETPEHNIGAPTDAETDEDYLSHRKEEDWPIGARVRYNPQAVSSPVSRNDSMLGHGQQLSTALEGVCSNIIETPGSRASTKEKEPIGTRLTMTSRTGYFQDRIVSPSLV